MRGLIGVSFWFSFFGRGAVKFVFFGRFGGFRVFSIYIFLGRVRLNSVHIRKGLFIPYRNPLGRPLKGGSGPWTHVRSLASVVFISDSPICVSRAFVSGASLFLFNFWALCVIVFDGGFCSGALISSNSFGSPGSFYFVVYFWLGFPPFIVAKCH